MDQTVETILIISVILGTTVFTVAGVWVILILRELAERIGEKVSSTY